MDLESACNTADRLLHGSLKQASNFCLCTCNCTLSDCILRASEETTPYSHHAHKCGCQTGIAKVLSLDIGKAKESKKKRLRNKHLFQDFAEPYLHGAVKVQML
eukprot:1160648-Pelagomonas_calceolata.AAC.10